MSFRQAFVTGFWEALGLFVAIARAPFRVLRAFVRHDLTHSRG